MKNYSIEKSKRIRSTPYTSRIEKQGVTAYTSYNHMLLPAAFGSLDLKDEKNKKIGELRSACYSPRFKKVVGIAMMYKSFWEKSQSFKIEINGDTFSGKVCDLPLI